MYLSQAVTSCHNNCHITSHAESQTVNTPYTYICRHVVDKLTSPRSCALGGFGSDVRADVPDETRRDTPPEHAHTSVQRAPSRHTRARIASTARANPLCCLPACTGSLLVLGLALTARRTAHEAQTLLVDGIQVARPARQPGRFGNGVFQFLHRVSVTVVHLATRTERVNANERSTVGENRNNTGAKMNRKQYTCQVQAPLNCLHEQQSR